MALSQFFFASCIDASVKKHSLLKPQIKTMNDTNWKKYRAGNQESPESLCKASNDMS
jgi:hypothetical protein